MICINCQTKGIDHRNLKLCGDCFKERAKVKRKEWEEKVGYKNPGYSTYTEEQRSCYNKKATVKRQTKRWNNGDLPEAWYCDWPNKVCITCGTSKPIKDFGRRTNKKDGHSSKCKTCSNKKAARYRRPRRVPPNLTRSITCHCITKAKNKANGRKRSAKKILDRGEFWGPHSEWPFKTCKVCQKECERWEFITDSRHSDGKGNKCRRCRGLLIFDEKEVYIKKRKRARGKKEKRRVAERLATPVWLSPEQKYEIESIYEHMRDCRRVTGEPYEVNHVVPIRGENVCGLHVPWNLEVLPRYVNYYLGNTFDGGW